MNRKRFRRNILQAADVLTNAVHVTLEPKSKRALIQKRFGKPIFSNDLTFTNQVKDSAENFGSLIHTAAALAEAGGQSRGVLRKHWSEALWQLFPPSRSRGGH